MQKRYKLFTIFLKLIVFVLLLNSALAERFPTADGEQTRRKAVATIDGSQFRLVSTTSTIYCSQFWTDIGWSKNKFLFMTDPGRTITDMSFQSGETGKKRTLWVLLDNAVTLYFTFNSQLQAFESVKSFAPPANQSIRPKKIIAANAVFLLNNSRVWINRKDTKGWFADTLGLKNITVSDICFLDSRTVLAATSKGVYSLYDTSATWSKFGSFDTTLSCTAMINARGNRIYVSTGSKGTFVTKDNGASWNRDTAGVGVTSLTRFGDDVTGTIYAIGGTSSNALYRKRTTDSSWSRIDSNLRNAAGATPTLYDAGGDSTLEVATNYCVYTSLNSGIDCAPTYTGIMSENIYSLHFLNNDKAVVATGFGVYTRAGQTSDWIKRYPSTGYLGAKIIKRDFMGNLFMQESSSGTGQTHQANVLKSTDGGVTWNYDTLGISIVPVAGGYFPAVFYVDPLSNQHFGLSSTSNSPIRIYSRDSYNPWGLDSAGAGFTAGSANTFKVMAALASDGISNLFASTFTFAGQSFNQPLVYRKNQLVGGNWLPDSAGLGDALISTFIAKSSGEMYAGSLINKAGVSSVYHKDITDSSWKSIPMPPYSSTDISSLAFDSTGALYVNFTPVYNNGTNWGVYLTDDNGATWMYAGLDSVPVRGLMGNGNDMYAYSSRGAYKLSAAPLKLPVMVLSSKTLNFGQVSQGAYKDSVITVNNTGKDTLRVTNITSTNPVFTAPVKSFNVAPGSSYNLTLRYTPAAQGVVNATLRLSSNTYPDSIKVSGEGINFKYPKMLLLAKVVDFGNVEGGKTKDTIINVTNYGDDTLKITQVRSNNTSFTTSTTSLIIAPGDTAGIALSFSPKTNSQINGIYTVYSNAANDTINAIGYGVDVSVPKMILSLKTIDFGNVETGKFKDSTFVISNKGTDTLVITNIRCLASVFTVSKNNAVLAPGDTIVITTKFSPVAANKYNSIVRITGNVPLDSVSLSGNGETPKSVEEPFGINSAIGYFNILPNPANPNSNIVFILQEDANVRLVLYDIAGNEIEEIASGFFVSGEYRLKLSMSERGNALSNGVYLLRLNAGTEVYTKLINLGNE